MKGINFTVHDLKSAQDIKEFDLLLWHLFSFDYSSKFFRFDVSEETKKIVFKKDINFLNSMASSVFLSFIPDIRLEDLNKKEGNIITSTPGVGEQRQIISHAEFINEIPFIYSYFVFVRGIFRENSSAGMTLSGLPFNVLKLISSISEISLIKLSRNRKFNFSIRYNEITLQQILQAPNKSVLRKLLMTRTQQIINFM